MKQFFVNESDDPKRTEALAGALADAVLEVTEDGNGATKAALKEALKEAGIFKNKKYTLLLKTIMSLFAATLLAAFLTWSAWTTTNVFAMQAQSQRSETYQKDTKAYINQNETKIDIMKEQLMEQKAQTDVLKERTTNNKVLLERIWRNTDEILKEVRK